MRSCDLELLQLHIRAGLELTKTEYSFFVREETLIGKKQILALARIRKLFRLTLEEMYMEGIPNIADLLGPDGGG